MMLKHTKHICLISSFVFLLCLQSLCLQGQIMSGPIQLKSGKLQTNSSLKTWIDSIVVNNKDKGPVLVLMQFDSIPTLSQKAILQQNGVTLLDYIPDNTYVALLQLQELKSSRLLNNAEIFNALPALRITSLDPKNKIDGALLNGSKVKNKNQENIQVLVSFYSHVSCSDISQYLSSIGANVLDNSLGKLGSLKVSLPASIVTTLASWYGVKYISVVAKPVPCDLESRPAVRGNVAVASVAFGGYGLLGDGITVGVGDNSSGIYHADLKDRVTNFCPGPISHHGEHVNGIVGGAANVDPLGVGMAPHVSLVDYFFDLILPETGAMFRDYQMNITNNSYAVILGDCSYAGTYDGYAQIIDTLALQFPKVLHVFASGNDGGNTCSPYQPGFATVAGGYQPAKNNLVVGSYTDFLEQAGDESRGPTKDGRMKPEIVATGLGAYSTIGVDDYEWAAGTSMASPQAAGGLALITQRYKQINGDALPNSDLLKALALNGALDLGNPGPDFSYGFGGMDVARSLAMLDSSNYFTAQIAQGGAQLFTIHVPPNTAQLKVMICWNDVPANPMAAKQLVNDIDIFVQDTGKVTHLPLVADPTPGYESNFAVEKADHLNNVEQVTINNPLAGD